MIARPQSERNHVALREILGWKREDQRLVVLASPCAPGFMALGELSESAHIRGGNPTMVDHRPITKPIGDGRMQAVMEH